MKESIYWLFSTSLQVIATFVGLMAAGFFFTHGKIEDEVKKDETLQEIYIEIKRQYYRRFKALFMLTAFSITLGLLVIYINSFAPTPFYYMFVILVATLNIFTIFWAGWFFIYMIDPEIITHTAQKLVKENKDIFLPLNQERITTKDFIGKFAKLEKLLRQITGKEKMGLAGQTYVPFADMTKVLFQQGVINKEQLEELNQISKARNLSSHTSVDFLENDLATSADKLNKELNVINDAEPQ